MSLDFSFWTWGAVNLNASLLSRQSFRFEFLSLCRPISDSAAPTRHPGGASAAHLGCCRSPDTPSYSGSRMPTTSWRPPPCWRLSSCSRSPAGSSGWCLTAPAERKGHTEALLPFYFYSVLLLVMSFNCTVHSHYLILYYLTLSDYKKKEISGCDSDKFIFADDMNDKCFSF